MSSAGIPSEGTTTTHSVTAMPSVQPTPPLFFDTFMTANKGWVITHGATYSRAIENHRLIMTASNHKIVPESLPTDATFDDVKVTVTLTLLQAGPGDGAGIYVRGDSNLDHDYRIEVYGNNTYAICKEYLDTDDRPQTLFLAGPQSAQSLRPLGQPNTLTVITKGPVLVLQVNDKVVKTITDKAYTKGQLALFVQNDMDSPGVKAAFSGVTVYPAPGQLPGS